MLAEIGSNVVSLVPKPIIQPPTPFGSLELASQALDGVEAGLELARQILSRAEIYGAEVALTGVKQVAAAMTALVGTI